MRYISLILLGTCVLGAPNPVPDDNNAASVPDTTPTHEWFELEFGKEYTKEELAREREMAIAKGSIKSSSVKPRADLQKRVQSTSILVNGKFNCPQIGVVERSMEATVTLKQSGRGGAGKANWASYPGTGNVDSFSYGDSVSYSTSDLVTSNVAIHNFCVSDEFKICGMTMSAEMGVNFDSSNRVTYSRAEAPTMHGICVDITNRGECPAMYVGTRFDCVIESWY